MICTLYNINILYTAYNIKEGPYQLNYLIVYNVLIIIFMHNNNEIIKIENSVI